MRVMAVAVLIVLSGCLGTAATTTDSNGTLDAQTVNTTELEQKIHEEVNEERTKRGLRPLDFDTELRTIARYHSEDMVEQDYLAHTAPDGETVTDRYERFEYDCDGKFKSGENIVLTLADGNVNTEHGTVDYNSNETRIAEGVVRGWINSEAHRENLFHSAWSKEGIGVNLKQTDNGVEVYITQNFC